MKSIKGEINADGLVWARGWPAPLKLNAVLLAYRTPDQIEIRAELVTKDEMIEPKKGSKKKSWRIILLSLVLFLGWWVNSHYKIKIELVRPADIRLERFRELKSIFDNSSEKIPLTQAAVSIDYSKIWLIDRSEQQCVFEGSFYSNNNQNLSGVDIHFQVSGVSTQHWITFNRLNFIEGQKLIPGRYKMNIERKDCRSEGLLAFWQAPDPNLKLELEVDLYSGDAQELGLRLSELAKKKRQESLKIASKNRQAWRDIEEKLRTLSAISLQIEQNFQELIMSKISWSVRLKRVIDSYTLKFGGFLTNFVVQNDADFNVLATQDLPQKVDVMGRQSMINAFGKRIGFLSMSLIEKLQKDKVAPNRQALKNWLTSFSKNLASEREKLKVAAEEAHIFATKVEVIQ